MNNDKMTGIFDNDEHNELMAEKQNELTLQDLKVMIEKLDSKVSKTANDVALVKSDLSKHNREIINLRDETSVTPAEAEDISSAVKARGVDCLGGKKSNAYKNAGIRRSVYRDIYFMMKREYGLVTEDGRQLSYKRLKRKYFKAALANIHSYELPQELENDITAENELELDD